ncbi:hypothetical protein HW932_21080 [Allochromatium humboldtianum]|uniref:Uncharacterized protein n=1 Tax=Allochromatium humboldtianum TaxID=504901 RepID=A0A850RCG3_9GAMM|nr:hypothetical protein [Allochromatium humboldtianum]NVZ11744.1 hypothetical protein [Allochromatium humboldtianum]
MKKHGHCWMDFLPDSIDGAQGIVVADYTHFSGNNCHYIIEIDNGIGMVGIYPMWPIPVDARAGQNQSNPATQYNPR